MWFWFSLIALLCWSGSDLFSKIGCQDADDKYSHLKMVIAVGVVMGLHAAYEIFIGGTEISWDVIVTYLPVSLLYIVSMTLGYVGLRYIELSISSPICNSSGALVAVLTLITSGIGGLAVGQLAATVLVCIGVIGLGIVEAHEDDELRAARQQAANRRYAKSALAIILPVLYCVLDALGTFADSRVLETLDEDSANCAYELTFLAAAVVCFIYVVIIKRQKLVPRREVPKYTGAIFETAGQFAYIYALADTQHVALAAPMISAYCVASVLWGRIFLKEKLSWKHYLMIVFVVAGIVLLGMYAKLALGEERGEFNVLLANEWLASALESQPVATVSGESWYFFGHCTEVTALPGAPAQWAAIFARFGAKLENVSVGCCGMAGTYGHEAKNHENSLGIYELSWHQAMQRLPRNRCLATGYSCRSQVKRVEGTGVRHPVQALLEIIK